jgi:hypothetical protein
MGTPIIISYGGALALLPVALVTIVLALIDRYHPATAPTLTVRG